MLSGNKGEWSEIYTFLKLLADGRLYAADENLEEIPSVYYPILKIFREETASKKREYSRSDKIIIIDGNTKTEITSIPVEKFIEQSKKLLQYLRESSGRSFQFSDIEEFLKKIDVGQLGAKSRDKSDILLFIHDLKTAIDHELGFSIKSMLGGKSTLFNSGNTTNFIFEVVGKATASLDVKEFNKIVSEPKITNRIIELKSRGLDLVFKNIQSDTLQLNLTLMDGDLPRILAELLLLKYSGSGGSSLSHLMSDLKKQNPLNYDLSKDHPFYEYKIKTFLTDVALGMTPSAIWTGKYHATGGIIIVKPNGNLVCYHIYNRTEFQEYLVNNTKLEQASTSRYEFGDLYNEDGKTFIKLNLQIRFTN